MGFSRKKFSGFAEQQSESVCLTYMAEIRAFDPAMLIWLDESGCDKRNAAQQYGYSLRGLDPRDYTFKSGDKRYTQLTAMSAEGVEDVYIAGGNIDGDRFLK